MRAAALAAVVAMWAAAGAGHADPKHMAVVPNVVGKTADQAIALIKSAGFVVDPEDQAMECDNHPADSEDGKVRCQSPAAGARVEASTIIMYDVLRADDKVSGARQRSLIGKTLDEAKAIIRTWKWAATGKLHIEKVAAVAPCKIDIICDVDASFDDKTQMTLKIGAQAHTKIAPPAP